MYLTGKLLHDMGIRPELGIRPEYRSSTAWLAPRPRSKESAFAAFDALVACRQGMEVSFRADRLARAACYVRRGDLVSYKCDQCSVLLIFRVVESLARCSSISLYWYPQSLLRRKGTGSIFATCGF